MAIDPDLVRVHQALDDLVDRALGRHHIGPTEAKRQWSFFTLYAKMAAK